MSVLLLIMISNIFIRYLSHAASGTMEAGAVFQNHRHDAAAVYGVITAY